MSRQDYCDVTTLFDTNIYAMPIQTNGTLWHEFGTWLKNQREDLRYSQAEAARRARIDRQQWYRIESGKSGTKRDTAIRIAKALSLDVEETLQRAGFASNEPFTKPVTAAQALAIIEKLLPGFDGVSLADGLTDDNAERLLEDFKTLIELQNRRLQK